MNYWITMHYPPHKRNFVGRFYGGIFLQDGKEYVAANMQPGDLVFKYESLSGPTLKEVNSAGKTVLQPCPRGHMGIVALMEVTAKLPIEKVRPTEYTDRTKSWRYFAETTFLNDQGFVPLARLNVLLGYSVNYRMRGFGEAGSGLKRISKETFDEIDAAFQQGTTW